MKHLLVLGMCAFSFFSCSVVPQYQQPTDTGTLSANIVDLREQQSYTLELAPAKHTVGTKQVDGYAYNGSFPGPILRVKQGQTLDLTLKNSTDAPSLLHSHGLRLQNAFDGSHLSTPETKPGTETVYRLTFPDPGIYWYHPHIRESSIQDLGAYGVYWVEPQDAKALPAPSSEHVIALDDIMLGGEVALDTTHALMGKYGNTMLVNGQVAPRSLELQPYGTHRLYLVNAANTRVFRLRGEGLTMRVVGADLGSVYEPFYTEALDIGPGMRYIIDVDLHRPNAVLFSQGTALTPRYDLLKFSGAVSEDRLTYRSPRDTQIAELMAKPFEPKHTWGIRMSMMMPGGSHAHHGMEHPTASGMVLDIEWEDTMSAMNAQSNISNTIWEFVDEETGKSGQDLTYTFAKGDMVPVRLHNPASGMHPMHHPFHVHGNRFLVVARNGLPLENPFWSDTTLIRAGETLDLYIDMSNPGLWMMHCHIPEHLESGMMFSYSVQ